MEISGRADLDNLVLATVLALGVPLEDKRYQKLKKMPRNAQLSAHANSAPMVQSSFTSSAIFNTAPELASARSMLTNSHDHAECCPLWR